MRMAAFLAQNRLCGATNGTRTSAGRTVVNYNYKMTLHTA